MSKRRSRVCPYTECALPDNNSKYVWQIVYLMLSFAYLIRAQDQVTFFSLTLFIAPTLLDLFYGKLKSPLLDIIRKIYIGADSAVTLFCVFGLFGIVKDNADSFSVVDSVLLFSGFEIKKRTLAVVMIFNLIIPFLYLYGSPSKRSVLVHNIVNEKSEHLEKAVSKEE